MVIRHGRIIHPGWSVGIDLIIWGLALPAVVFSVGVGWFWWWQPVMFVLKDGSIPCVAYNYWSKPCNPLIYRLGKMEIAASVFLALTLIAHFILFVRACVLTHQLRKRKGLESNARRNIELQYRRDPADHEWHAPAYPVDVAKRESAGSPVSPVSPVSATNPHDSTTKYA